MRMKYQGTTLPDSISVKSIFTVFRPDYSALSIGADDVHDFPEIIYISKGSHSILVDGAAHSMDAGQMIICAPGAGHKSKEKTNSLGYIISFEADSQSLCDLYNKVITLNTKQKQLLTEIIDMASKCFKKREPCEKIGGMVLRDGVTEYELQKIKKQLELFLISIYEGFIAVNTSTPDKQQSKSSAELNMVIAFLEAHITEPLSLSEIAEGCSMSTSKLKGLFRDGVGDGPINHLINLKIERAKLLISQGNLNFTEISESLGFSSLHYFSRLFKKRTGLSPSEYLKEL